MFLLSVLPSNFPRMKTMTPKAKKPAAADSVVAEVRRTKVKLLERFHYDLAAMARDARARQSQSGHEVVDKSAAS